MCIAIACFPDFDVISFENNLIFSIKLFFYMSKKSRQKLKYLETELNATNIVHCSADQIADLFQC